MTSRRSGLLVEWDPAYSLDITVIDRQHRMLVSMIRQLQQAMLGGNASAVIAPLFQAMNRYTQYHFQYEERLLKEHGYPQADNHHERHEGLIAKLHELETKYSSGQLKAGTPLMQFLRNWLVDHIGSHDKAYAGFLKEKGLS
jgi:hemerythrin